MAKHKKKIRIEDNSKGAQLKNAQLKQKKATDNKNAYSKNRVIEFWTVMALIVFSIGGYAVYAGFHLYPEYEAVRNDKYYFKYACCLVGVFRYYLFPYFSVVFSLGGS